MRKMRKIMGVMLSELARYGEIRMKTGCID
jgi:hypothetical protein